jgi:CCR4-NOT transcription complex subunit 6
MTALGYEGRYKAKTREGDASSKVDGCALFYRPERFTLRDEHTVEFNQLVANAARNGHFSGGSPPANQQSKVNRATKRLSRDNIAQIAVFDVVGEASSSAPLVVCNTHIFWDPEYPEVKLWQTHQLMTQIQNVLRQTKQHTQTVS